MNIIISSSASESKEINLDFSILFLLVPILKLIMRDFVCMLQVEKGNLSASFSIQLTFDNKTITRAIGCSRLPYMQSINFHLSWYSFSRYRQVQPIFHGGKCHSHRRLKSAILFLNISINNLLKRLVEHFLAIYCIHFSNARHLIETNNEL